MALKGSSFEPIAPPSLLYLTTLYPHKRHQTNHTTADFLFVKD